MKLGLYRTKQQEMGECARVHWWAGDCAPYLMREIYEHLGFEPKFEKLPTVEEFERRHTSGPMTL